jgi:phage-related minor tail protein
MIMAENTLDTLAKDIEYIKGDVEEVKGDVKELKAEVKKYYLTIKQFESEFKPVRNIIYGMVAVILVAVLTALVMLVIKGGA